MEVAELPHKLLINPTNSIRSINFLLYCKPYPVQNQDAARVTPKVGAVVGAGVGAEVGTEVGAEDYSC